MSQPGTRLEQEDRLGGVDLTKLKQLLEETQRHLHEERKLVFYSFITETK